jgi:hypothetical protein
MRLPAQRRARSRPAAKSPCAAFPIAVLVNCLGISAPEADLKQAVEIPPLAALLQKVQTLTYVEYASALNFLCALPEWFLNGLR